MWWLTAAAVLFIAWFCWQLFGPNPPIIVSRETTYITEPLRPEGVPDYGAHLLATLRDGVTPENNAAVVMWQAFGLGGGYDEISADDWQRLDKELSLGPVPELNRTLTAVHSKDNRAAVLEWLSRNAVEWKRAPTEDPAALAELNLTQADLDADSVIDIAMESPWRHDDLPPPADWLTANKSIVDSLVGAAGRSRFYSPGVGMIRSAGGSLSEKTTFDQIGRTREVARVLRLRAMLHLGEGRPEQAWQDLLAAHRWARLVAQGPFIVDQLVAIAIEGVSAAGTQAILREKLSPNLARKIHADLLALDPASDVARSFDEGERLFFLDSVVSYSRKGIGSFYADSFRFNIETAKSNMPEWEVEGLNLISVDWNLSLVQGNRWYDQLAAAVRLPKYEDRWREISRLGNEFQNRESALRGPWSFAATTVNRGKRKEMLATASIAALSPILYAASEAQDRASAQLDLTRIAAALAVYRAEHGEYPERLEQLVPAIIPKLPVDLYHEKPFVYQRDGDGYLLYSAGPNGIDDGGSNEQREVLAGREIGWNEDDATEKLRQQIPAGADDIAIQVPRPAFKLPSPPSNHLAPGELPGADSATQDRGERTTAQ